LIIEHYVLLGVVRGVVEFLLILELYRTVEFVVALDVGVYLIDWVWG
jgi:hypothetical protein